MTTNSTTSRSPKSLVHSGLVLSLLLGGALDVVLEQHAARAAAMEPASAAGTYSLVAFSALGTAQTVKAAQTLGVGAIAHRNFLEVINPDNANPVWCSIGTTAVIAGSASFMIGSSAGGFSNSHVRWDGNFVPADFISCIGSGVGVLVSGG